jgi:hypothetical protein
MYAILKLSAKPDGRQVISVKHQLIDVTREAMYCMPIRENDKPWYESGLRHERDLVASSLSDAFYALKSDLRNYFFFQITAIAIAGINQDLETTADWHKINNYLHVIHGRNSLEIDDIDKITGLIRPMTKMTGKYEFLIDHIVHMRSNLDYLRHEFSKIESDRFSSIKQN